MSIKEWCINLSVSIRDWERKEKWDQFKLVRGKWELKKIKRDKDKALKIKCCKKDVKKFKEDYNKKEVLWKKYKSQHWNQILQ